MDRSGTGVAVAGIFPGGLFRLLLTAAQARVIAGAPGRALRRHRATACTDVTGFGLLGHLVEMTRASGVDVDLDLPAVPVLAGALDTSRAGFLSSLHPHNIRLRRAVADVERVAADPRYLLLYDPQTAGGLLAGVPAERARACVEDLRTLGYRDASIIGTVVARDDRDAQIRITA